MTDKPRTFEDKLAQWLHHQISAACNDKWKEGDRCSDCEQEVTRVLMPIIANARDSEIAAKDRRIAELERELNEEQLAHEDIGVLCGEVGAATKDGTSVSAVESLVEMYHALKAQIDRVRALAERYITREEHNNIIRMNETVHERDVAERVQSAYERGVSDGAAARAPIVTKEQLGIITDDEGNDHWGTQPRPGAPEAGGRD